MDRKVKRHQISEQFIFSWLPEKNTARTLISFIIFSIIIHFMGFYLFQVDYPKTDLPEFRPDRITLLDAKSNDVRPFLERAHDRTVFLDPASQESISRIKLSDYTIRFVPSFAEAKPTLKEASVNATDLKYPVPDLPLLDRVENWKNPVTFSQNLLKRGIAPNTILDNYLDLIPHIPKIRVNLTVHPDGIPTVVQSPVDSMEENMKILAHAIESTLRFNPDESRGDDPGWLILGSDPGDEP